MTRDFGSPPLWGLRPTQRTTRTGSVRRPVVTSQVDVDYQRIRRYSEPGPTRQDEPGNAERSLTAMKSVQPMIESTVDFFSQRSITDFWNRQSLPILKAGICPRFNNR